MKFLFTPLSQNCAFRMFNVQFYYERKSHYNIHQMNGGLRGLHIRVFNIFQKDMTDSNRVVKSLASQKQTLISKLKLI